MVNLARKNASKQGYTPPQVVFIQTQLAQPLPVETASVDCILSNCVINLLPEAGKAALLKETYRVLKPDGRFVVDDVSPHCAVQLAPVDLNFYHRLSEGSPFQTRSGTILRATSDAYQERCNWSSTELS
jgi:ubiquinone/menaquinone biosynthesis C-methylase UbiE